MSALFCIHNALAFVKRKRNLLTRSFLCAFLKCGCDLCTEVSASKACLLYLIHLPSHTSVCNSHGYIIIDFLSARLWENMVYWTILHTGVSKRSAQWEIPASGLPSARFIQNSNPVLTLKHQFFLNSIFRSKTDFLQTPALILVRNILFDI